MYWFMNCLQFAGGLSNQHVLPWKRYTRIGHLSSCVVAVFIHSVHSVHAHCVVALDWYTLGKFMYMYVVKAPHKYSTLSLCHKRVLHINDQCFCTGLNIEQTIQMSILKTPMHQSSFKFDANLTYT